MQVTFPLGSANGIRIGTVKMEAVAQRVDGLVLSGRLDRITHLLTRLRIPRIHQPDAVRQIATALALSRTFSTDLSGRTAEPERVEQMAGQLEIGLLEELDSLYVQEAMTALERGPEDWRCWLRGITERVEDPGHRRDLIADGWLKIQFDDFALRTGGVVRAGTYPVGNLVEQKEIIPSFLNQVDRRLSQVPHPELALTVYEIEVELEKADRAEKFLFNQMVDYSNRLEWALGFKIRLCKKERDKTRILFRFLPPRFIQAALQCLHGSRFQRFVYWVGESPPDLMQKFQDRGIHITALPWKETRFNDIVERRPVHPLYYWWHDIYHAADKTIIPQEVLSAGSIMRRALRRMPHRWRSEAFGRMMAKNLLDLDAMEKCNLRDLVMRIWLPVHYYFVVGIDEMERRVRRRWSPEAHPLLEPQQRIRREFNILKFFAGSYKELHDQNRWFDISYYLEMRRRYSIPRAPIKRLKSYRDFVKQYLHELRMDPESELIRDILKYLGNLEIALEEQLRDGTVPKTNRKRKKRIHPMRLFCLCINDVWPYLEEIPLLP